MNNKAVTLEQLLESARQGEALTMQVAEATAADVTALETGKAAVGHTHTAADVGAAAANHTHTAASVGAAAASHTHTASDVGAVPRTGGTMTGTLYAKDDTGYTTSKVRNVSFSTTNLTAGSSSLTSGAIKMIYE